MATATQGPPIRTKTTIFKETLPPAERAITDAQPSEFYRGEWEQVLNKLTPEMWEFHLLRVYRADEKWDRESSPVDNKFKFAPTEEDLRKRFGGGKFLLWLYGPPKEQNLVARWRVPLEGEPIVNSVPRNGNGAQNSESVAIEAMRMYANPEFVRMQMQMMVTAATEAMSLIKSQMPAAQDPLQTLRNAKEILGLGGPSPMDEINKMLLTAMVQKFINPQESNSLDATLSLVEKIKNSGLFPGAAKADLMTTFVSQIPMLVDRAVHGLQEFRLSNEAEARRAALEKDARIIDMPPQPPPQNNPAPSQPAATTPTNGAVSPETAQAIIAQSHLHRLVAGIKNPKSTGQDMYDYLVNAWPEILDELAKMSPATLLAFFKSRDTQIQYFGAPILTEVADEPRLPKLLEDFLRIAKDQS